MGVSSAGSQHTWFIVVMAVFVAAMLVIFFTRRLEPRWEWLRETMMVLRSPIIWGAVVGVLVGIRGIPVVIPGTGAIWVWAMPSGAYVASVTGFGVAGCLVGAVIQFWSRRVVSWKIGIWAFGVPALALLIGTVGLYRMHAQLQNSTRYLSNMGLSGIPATAAILDSQDSTQQDMNRAAGWLIRAGADLGAASQFKSASGARASYQEVGDGLSNAGYTILLSRNSKHVQQAEKYVDDVDAIVKHAEKMYPRQPLGDIPGLVNQIASITPQSYLFGIAN